MLKRIGLIAVTFFLLVNCCVAPAVAALHVPLGMNSNGTSYYSPDVMFKNMMTKMTNWAPYDTGKKGRAVSYHLDPDGCGIPNQEYTGLWTWIGIHGSPFYTGDYVLLWDGDGIVTVDNNGNPFPGTVAGDHRVTFTLTSWPGLLTVRITRSNLADPVHNIRLLQAQFESNYLTDPYHPDFIALISKFDTFRFMDLGGVSSFTNTYQAAGPSTAVTANTVKMGDDASAANDYYKGWFLSIQGNFEWPRRLITGYDAATKTITVSPGFRAGELVASPIYTLYQTGPSKWSERTRPSELLQGTPKGISMDHIVGMCNKAHVNPWVCIPNTADDDYVRQMAIYFRDNLDPTLKVYIEWSNETWNYYYPGFTVAYSMGRFFNLTGNPPWSYHAYRATQIFHIWNEVFGYPDLTASRSANRLVRLLASQAGYASGPTKAIVEFNGWLAGEPFVGHKAAEFADAVAIAPYFGGVAPGDAGSGNIVRLLDQYETEIGVAKGYSQQNLVITQANNLDLVAYEGGQGMALNTLSNEDWGRIQPTMVNLFRSPRWRSLMVQYLNSWNSLGENSRGYGVGVFCLFNFMGTLSKYGYWAHRDQQVNVNDTNPRWQGILDYLSERQIPVPPNELIANAISGHDVHLVWYDNSYNETGFELERRRQADPTFQLAHSLSAGATSYMDTNLEIGQAYVYRLRAVNASGESEYSNEAHVVMPTADATIPDRPRDVIAAPDSAWSIRVTWMDASSTETKFVVERRNPGSTVFQVVAEYGPNVRQYIDDGLAPDTTYTYRVTAYRGAWASQPSNLASALTFGPPSGVPASFAATLIPPNSVKLSWKDTTTNEKNYMVYRRASGETTFKLLSNLEADTTSYTDTDLVSNYYFYRLDMKKADDGVAQSSLVMAYVPNPVPEVVAPEHLVAALPAQGHVRLSWVDMSDNETGFVMERKAGSSLTWEEIGRTPAGINNFDDFPNSGLADNFLYRIRAVGALANSDPSNEVEVYPWIVGSGADAPVGGGGGYVILPGANGLLIRSVTSNAPCGLTIHILNRLGEVRKLQADATSSQTDVLWDLRTDQGSRAAAGVYVFRGACGSEKIKPSPSRTVLVR